MKQILGLGSGNLYKFFGEIKEQNKIIALLSPLCQKYNIGAYELTYSAEEELDIPLNEQSIAFLQNMEYVSIHFPFKTVITKENHVERIMEKVSKICQLVNVRQVIIHPRQVPDIPLLKYYSQKYNISIIPEIEDWKGVGYEKFITFLEECGLPFVFDTGHCEFHDLENIKDLVRKYGNRISQLHVNKVKDGHAHHHFHLEGMSATLPLVKDLQVPFIIEQKVEKDDLLTLENEIIFLKKYLGKI